MTATSLENPARTWFLNHLLEIESRSRACLSHLYGDRKQDALAEIMGAVFKASVHAQRSGVLSRITPFHAVDYAVRQYRVGRRLGGYSSTDVLAEATHIKGRCRVVSLSSIHTREFTKGRIILTVADTLAAPKHDSPLEQVRKNFDYPAILKCERVGPKAIQVFKHLAADRVGGRGRRIAQALKISPGRVTQLKQRLARALARHDYDPN